MKINLAFKGGLKQSAGDCNVVEIVRVLLNPFVKVLSEPDFFVFNALFDNGRVAREAGRVGRWPLHRVPLSNPSISA